MPCNALPTHNHFPNYFMISTGKMDCDVAIVGGGFSGLYMAYRLLKDTQEKGVCVFEKDSRLGGRLYDFFFDEAPEISVGKPVYSFQSESLFLVE